MDLFKNIKNNTINYMIYDKTLGIKAKYSRNQRN
jgi:hypothetical protein